MHVLEELAAEELLVVLEDEEHLLKNESSEELLFFNNISVEHHCTAEVWGVPPEFSGNCIPGFLKDSCKSFYLTNIFVIIAIGGIGNLLTIVSVCYVFLRYPSTRLKYPWLKNPLTILILHLSFCDLLYCLFGLPFLTLPPLYGYFPFSERTCRVTSLLRNLNAYAEFLTIALIALLRLTGMMRERFRSPQLGTSSLTPCRMILFCCMIWILAFIIISPIVFHVKKPVDFGRFGYNPVGMCNFEPSISSDSIEGLVHTIAFAVPFLIINISYVTLSCILKHRSRRIRNVLEAQHTDTEKVSKMLMFLCISYLVLVGSLTPIEWADSYMKDSTIKAYVTLLSYSWYWWNYTIHFLVISLYFKDFSKIYSVFLKDVFSYLSSCLAVRNNQSTNLAGRARATNAAEAAETAGGTEAAESARGAGITNHGFQINNFYVFGENSDILRSVNVYNKDKHKREMNGSDVLNQNQSMNEKLNTCKPLFLDKSAKKNLKKCNSV